MYCVLMISLVNNGFQINKYTIIFDTVKGYARLFYSKHYIFTIHYY